MRALWVVVYLLWFVGCARALRIEPAARRDDTLTTVIAGSDLALKSSGVAWEDVWRIERSGYVGTYVHLESTGDVTIAAEVFGGISMPDARAS